MYQVTLETVGKGKVQSKKETYVMGTVDTPEYAEAMEKLADVLFGLDIDFDTVEGEGDIMVDDILIAVSEEEEFFKKIGGRRCMYIVEGKFI